MNIDFDALNEIFFNGVDLTEIKLGSTVVWQKGQATSDSNNELREQIVAYATQFIGNPYVYGGTSLTNGCDSNGFVKTIFAHFGKTLVSPGTRMFNNAPYTKTLSTLKKGDLVFYGTSVNSLTASIYLGQDSTISSWSESTGITVKDINWRTVFGYVSYID